MSASLTARRALEALRAGVPNRDAVRALGFNGDALLELFSERLEQVASGISDGGQQRGLLIAAEFGGGKSHALEYLSHRALSAGFAVSKVVISKETQLFDPAKVFSAAIDSLQVADRTGSVLDEIALSRLDAGHPRFDDFSMWLGTSGLNSRFDATMYLYREAGANEELQQRLVSFWSGRPLQVTQLKKDLRSCGAASFYPIEKIGAKDLARERFRFMARLLHAAGYNGWLILLDELELIGRYSFLQRGRSYAELCRLMGLDEESAVPGLFVVGAITPDFETAVIREGKDDINQIGFRFRARGDADSDLTAALAERMMLEIQRSCIRLPEPDDAALSQTLLRLAEVYGEAYGVPPSTQEPDGMSVGWQMREYVRSWITRWDLQRIDPAYVSRTEVERIETDYIEDT
ncbi:MAG: DUF2791 family P-loop domain-containing protein, partial [Actinomycetota bacterium]|nr:DUF2791 family P-loop domain-containing protein [Actinomycetota bacterium]